jgi:hypothetical protein
MSSKTDKFHMTKEDLDKKIKEAKKQYESILNRIYKEYAFSNNEVCIGDVVVDGEITIRVEKFGFYKKFGGESAMRYFGPRLKKDGAPYKSNEHFWVYQR